MNKRDVNKILNRLNKLRGLIDEIDEIVEADNSTGSKQESTNPSTHSSKSLENQSLQMAWTALKKELSRSQHPTVLIEQFFADKTKKEIEGLAKANALPIDAKAAKKQQISQLIQLLKVNRAIEGL